MSLQLTGLNELLANMSKPINFTPALKGIKVILIDGTRENFLGQHDPDGKPWKPLKRPRRRKRDLVRGKKRGRAKKGQDQILLDTGILRASITASDPVKASDNQTAKQNKATAGSAHVEEMTGTSLEWGTNLNYAAVHQYGYPPRNIPARPFLGINDQMSNDIAELVGDFIEARLK